MAAYRVLIVDDQKEVSRVFRAGLETLTVDFDITDVPSGEEALLEFSLNSFDLLVADVLLPGISGLELMEKLLAQQEELKVILISGVTEKKIRRQVAEAGADAFFFKPVEMADFLDAVERALGMVESILPTEMEVEIKETAAERKEENSPKGLSNRIADLHKELEAVSVVLLSDLGNELVQAGKLPPEIKDAPLMSAIMAAVSASTKVSIFLGLNSPEGILCFKGQDYELFISHVGMSYALLVTTQSAQETQIATVSQAIRAAVNDITSILSSMGVAMTAEESPPEAPPELEEEEIEGLAGDLENLFKQAELKPEDVDEFWDAASTESSGGDVSSADSLSYDQARQLGLAPGEE